MITGVLGYSKPLMLALGLNSTGLSIVALNLL
jgi:hypothetical protein